MNISSSKPIILYFTFLIFSTSSVFGVDSSKDNEFIWKANKNVYFKYAEQDSSIFGLNEHPVELKSDEIKAALKSLKLLKKDNAPSYKQSTSVFTAQQINLLSQYLAKGLITAKPNQDIIFALEKSRHGLLGLKTERFFVAGRAFYKDNKLNIIIGNYDRARDEGFEAAYDPTHVGIVSYQFDYGRRSTNSDGFNKAIIKFQGLENKLLDGHQRNDWLLIDLKLAPNTSNFKPEAQKETARKRNEQEELSGNEGARRSHPSAETRPTTGSIEERLTILNRLKEKGLITDKEYTTKRKQILDDF
jgi:hypothetical protein